MNVILTMLLASVAVPLHAEPAGEIIKPEDLGTPASVEATIDGKKASFVAEVVPFDFLGAPWEGAKVGPEVRHGCKWRVVRRTEDEPDGRVIAGFQAYDPRRRAVDGRDPLDPSIPWVQSIVVGDGTVWALFVKDVFQEAEFRLFRTKMDVPGRKLRNRIDYDHPILKPEPWFEERMSTQYVDVYLELGWQQELFDFYKGAFKITGYKDGVLEFRCLVLPDTTELRKKERRRYLQAYEDFKIIGETNPGSDNPYPGRPLQDEELVLRYIVKEKRWEMTVPEGNFPVPYTLHRDMMYLSKERENAMFEREITERRKMGIKPENPRYRPLPPENRR